MPSASDISDAAAAWLVRLEAQTTPELWDEFQAWVDGSPQHRAAFIRLREAWKRVDLLKNMRPMDGTIDADLLAQEKITPATVQSRGLEPLAGTPRRRPAELLRPERRRVGAIAAAIAATGVFAWFATYHLGWESYETGIGVRQQVQLKDGSLVDLNTNTRLNVRISGGRRDITLTSGEALFHVAHDSSRPFYVTAAGTVVRAVGTAFSVRIRDTKHVDVMVEEGRVAVAAPGSDANFENPALLATATLLSVDEGASVAHEGVNVQKIPRKDILRKLHWTTGTLDFQGTTLEDAIQEFNRYNRRQIVIADPAIRTVRLGGGNFTPTDLPSFVDALQRTFGFRVEARNDAVRLFAGDTTP